MTQYKSTLADNSARLYDIFRSPIVTEKSTAQTADSAFSFYVASDATKQDIKVAAEKLFKVDVVSVSTSVQKGKTKRFRGIKGVRADQKKAVIRLKKGQSIDVTGGVK